MKTWKRICGAVVLCLFGLFLGALCWEAKVIPLWLLPFSLLPVATFLDYSSHKTVDPSWGLISKYALTVCVVLLVLVGYLFVNVEFIRNAITAPIAALWLILEFFKLLIEQEWS